MSQGEDRSPQSARRGGGPTCGDFGHRNKRGDLCGQYVVRGTQHCRNHAGRGRTLARLRAEGAVVTEVRRWRLDDQKVDPGEVLLRLVSQSVWRCTEYAGEVARLVDEAGTLTAALTGDALTLSRDGEAVKVGEYIRAMVALEAGERDRCAGFAAKAVAAGLAERQVRVAEQQVELVARAMSAAFAEMGLSADQQREAIRRVGGHLRLASG